MLPVWKLTLELGAPSPNGLLPDLDTNVAPDANKDGAYDLLGGIEEILDLPVKVTATDKDGSSLSTVMKLGVEDDIPFFGEVQECYSGEEEGFSIVIKQTDADITHDESKGVQWWDSDDQSFGDAGWDAVAATHKATDAGFSLPYGDSIGSLWPKGIAQTQIIASFGADQSTQEHNKDPLTANTSVRNSIFGALQDRLFDCLRASHGGVSYCLVA